MAEIDPVLPYASFVKFTARKLANPNILWRNPLLSTMRNIEDYTYALPHIGDASTSFGSEVKEFFADRYGGKGVGRNGGSGRCGQAGELQIKGIGPTPLVGIGNDKTHSHGGATLNEAVREAIWGEIYHRVTPHGASQVQGIIGTNTYTYSIDTKYAENKRALILRYGSIRPAHFMRACYFDSIDANISGPGADGKRTRCAIYNFSKAICKHLSIHATSDQAETINSGLTEMFRRFAAQVAAIQVKRIPHGSLNCSNVTIGGKLIDFSTATSVPGFAPYIVTRGSSTFLSEEESFEETIKNLRYYVDKYLFSRMDNRLLSCDDLVENYTDDYERSLAMEFSKLAGLPAEFLVRVPDVLLRNFLTACVKFISAQDKGPVLLSWTPISIDLCEIIREIVFCNTSHEALNIFNPQECRFSSLSAVIEAYFALRDTAFNVSDSADYTWQHLFCALNSLRLTTPIRRLFRDQLKADVESLVNNSDIPAVYHDFIENTSEHGINLREDAKDGQFRIDFICGFGSKMTLSGPRCMNGGLIGNDQLLDLLRKSFPNHKAIPGFKFPVR